MNRIYISGKITGLHLTEAKFNFFEAEKHLRLRGLTPINPFNIVNYEEDKHWEEYMIECIRVLFKCDAIFMLKNWKDSKGARIERHIAEEMGMQIMYE